MRLANTSVAHRSAEDFVSRPGDRAGRGCSSHRDVSTADRRRRRNAGDHHVCADQRVESAGRIDTCVVHGH
jgi:hypothetical protein